MDSYISNPFRVRETGAEREAEREREMGKKEGRTGRKKLSLFHLHLPTLRIKDLQSSETPSFVFTSLQEIGMIT